MARTLNVIASLFLSAGVATAIGQAAPPTQAAIEAAIAGSRPNGDRVMKDAVMVLLEQGATPEAIAKAMTANGLPPETTIGILRALEVSPAVVIKAMHAAVPDAASKGSLNSILMSMGLFGPTVAMIVSPGTTVQADSLSADSIIKDAIAIGAGDYLGEVARVLVNVGVKAESLALALVNQGLSPQAAITVMKAAAIPPAQISSALYAAVPPSQVAALDAAALASGVPLAATGAGQTPQTNTNTAAAPAASPSPAPFTSGSGGGGGGSSATASPS